jgi:hypothetical protein
MHVLLIEVEERNSEGKIPSILVKERESRGRNSRPSKRWTKNCPSSSERGAICMESRGCNKSEEKSPLNSNGRYECWRNDYRWPPSITIFLRKVVKIMVSAQIAILHLAQSHEGVGVKRTLFYFFLPLKIGVGPYLTQTQ